MELREYVRLIEEYERVKNFEKLSEIVEDGLKEYPFSSTIKIAKLRVLVHRGEYSKAEDLANDLIRNNPGNSQIHMLLGQMYEQMGKYEKALSEYEKVKFLDPFNEDVDLKIRSLKSIGNEYEPNVIGSIEGGEFKQEVNEEFFESEVEEESEEESFDGSKIEEMKIEEKVEEEGGSIEEETVQEMSSLEENSEFNVIEEEGVELEGETENKEVGVEEERESESEVKVEDEKHEIESNVEDEIGDTLVEDLFETYSMGKVYETQGEYSKAKEIYRKLYNSKKDEKYIRAYKRVGLKQYEKFLLSMVGKVIDGKRNT